MLLHQSFDADFFMQEMKTALDVKFTYDSQSVTHMTIEEAQEISVGLSSKDNMVHPIKVAPDHKLSEVSLSTCNIIQSFYFHEGNNKETRGYY